MKGNLKLIYNLELDYEDLQDMKSLLNNLVESGEIYDEDLYFLEKLDYELTEGIEKIEKAISRN